MESESSTRAASIWSEDEISKIKDYYEFCKQMTDYCNNIKSLIEKVENDGRPLDRREVRGDIKIPTVPKYNILNVLCKDTPLPADADDNLKLHETLKGFLATEIVPFPELQPDYDNNTAEELVIVSKQAYDSIISSERNSLVHHLDFGLLIMRVRRAFIKNRKRWKVDEVWSQWISRRTKISKSYVYKHIQLTRLCLQYTKLSSLAVSFNYLYSKRQQIIQMFEDNAEIAEQWK